MINFKVLPNILTSFRMALSLISIFMLVSRTTNLWVWFFVVALVLDVLDGAVARKLNVASELGTQLDSFADYIAFGIIPALFIFIKCHYDSTIAIMLMFFLLAGAFRLSLYNTKYANQSCFHGVPIPFAAFVLVISMNLNLYFLILVILILAISMIMPVKVPSLKGMLDSE